MSHRLICIQGELEDEVYMEQPEMFIKRKKEKYVCKLIKPLYGLKQSGREWYRKLDNYITKNGGKQNAADPCVYVIGKNEDRVIIIVYVDDLILVSKKIENINIVKLKIKSAFKIVDIGEIKKYTWNQRATRRSNRKNTNFTKQIY